MNKTLKDRLAGYTTASKLPEFKRSSRYPFKGLQRALTRRRNGVAQEEAQVLTEAFRVEHPRLKRMV
mgnify:FL=1